ncbi:MAG: hypothetical protein M3Q65_09490 [Chloroflexota bacterium]|nr:hypothetical protein [Chloroflexota bacterium]
MEGERHAREKYGGDPGTPDEKYFVYGKEQQSYHLRPEYLQTALDISTEYGGDGMYLLNVEEAGGVATPVPGAA